MSKLVSKWQEMKIRNIISEEYYVALTMTSSGSSEISIAVIDRRRAITYLGQAAKLY